MLYCIKVKKKPWLYTLFMTVLHFVNINSTVLFILFNEQCVSEIVISVFNKIVEEKRQYLNFITILFAELSSDVGLSAESEISRVMKSVLDRLQQEISTRFTRLRNLNSKFGFLLDVENLLNKDNDENGLEKNCKNLGEFYNTDFNGTLCRNM